MKPTELDNTFKEGSSPTGCTDKQDTIASSARLLCTVSIKATVKPSSETSYLCSRNPEFELVDTK